MVMVGVSKDSRPGKPGNQAGSNKMDSVVHFCVPHWCRDTLHNQMHKAALKTATAVEVVCQQTSKAKN